MLLRNDTLQDYIYVVVRSFTAESNLLQPTGGVNSTPHTSHFLVDSHLMTRACVAQAQVWRAQRTFHIISCVIFMRSCCVLDSPRLSLLSSCCLSSLLSFCSSTWSSASSSTMWWTNSLCTSANEDLGTLAEHDPLTTTEYSSSSWWSTSRGRRWSDWILDKKGLSSERFCAFSILV